ncbi:MAG: hypothetical protein CMJ44_16730 [Pimelobacter sp.]|nr:hypothetical protein [Pimelobacter sp.]
MAGRWCARVERAQRGAVAVEAALVGAFILVPLLLGVITYGNYFWRAQKVDTLSVSGLPPATIAGTYTCQELVDRVKSLLAGNVHTLASELGIADDAIQTVVTIVPTASIGADVSVSFSIPVVDAAASLLPLPNGGNVVTDFSQRLENVSVSSTSC